MALSRGIGWPGRPVRAGRPVTGAVMFAQQDYLKHQLLIDQRDNGEIILSSGLKIDPVVRNTGEWLHQWAEKTPNAVFLAERSGPGWTELRYGEALGTGPGCCGRP